MVDSSARVRYGYVALGRDSRSRLGESRYRYEGGTRHARRAYEQRM